MTRGKLVVIEGTDGTGKGTQFELLKKRLKKAGYKIATFDYPRYEEPSSYFVREYLTGSYGTLKEVGPYTSSVFFAVDRYAGSFNKRKSLSDGRIVLCNRYVGSNMGHQGAKFSDVKKRQAYFKWLF